jgi:hypothetical protein
VSQMLGNRSFSDVPARRNFVAPLPQKSGVLFRCQTKRLRPKIVKW